MQFNNLIKSKSFLFSYLVILVVGFLFLHLMDVSLFSAQFASIFGVIIFVIIIVLVIALSIKPALQYNVSPQEFAFDYIVTGIWMALIGAGSLLVYLSFYEEGIKLFWRIFMIAGGLVSSIIGLIIFIKNSQKHSNS